MQATVVTTETQEIKYSYDLTKADEMPKLPRSLILSIDPGYKNTGVYAAIQMYDETAKTMITEFIYHTTMSVVDQDATTLNLDCGELRHKVAHFANKLQAAVGQKHWNNEVVRYLLVEDQYINPYGDKSVVMVGHQLRMLQMALTSEFASLGFMVIPIKIKDVRALLKLKRPEVKDYAVNKMISYNYCIKEHGNVITSHHEADALLQIIYMVKKNSKETHFRFPAAVIYNESKI